MNYITFDDILSEVGSAKLAELTSFDGNEINPERVGLAIASASNLVDAYLFVRYNLPLEFVPDIIKHITKQIAIYYLYLGKYRESLLPIEILTMKTDAINLLEKFSTGDILLHNPRREAKIIHYSGNRYFNDEHLNEFRNYRE